MLWVYKKRQAKDNNVESRAYEMEGNPCYEASNCVKQTTDTQKQEIHVYERVNTTNLSRSIDTMYVKLDSYTCIIRHLFTSQSPLRLIADS